MATGVVRPGKPVLSGRAVEGESCTGMVGENSQVVPSSTAKIEGPQTRRAPRRLSGILLFVGAWFLLLLNGQHFTNRLVFLVCVLCSGFMWYRYHVYVRHHHPNAGRLALVIHLILFTAFAATLPDAFARQEKFNIAAKRIEAKSGPPTR